MKGVHFPEATMRLLPPEGHEEAVHSLHVWRHPQGGLVISKWRMTWRERLSCLWNGYVWFHCWGNTHPPMTIETSYPFEQSGVSMWQRFRFPVIALTVVGAIALLVYFLGAYQ